MVEATFERQMIGGIPVVSVTGEVDTSNVKEFQHALDDTFASASPLTVISFEDATYIDSRTIAAVIDFAERLGNANRELALAAPEEHPCRRIFRVIGLESMVDVFDTVDEAVLSRTRR